MATSVLLSDNWLSAEENGGGEAEHCYVMINNIEYCKDDFRHPLRETDWVSEEEPW